MINHKHSYEIIGTSETKVSEIGDYQNRREGIKTSEVLKCAECGFQFVRSVAGIEFRPF